VFFINTVLEILGEEKTFSESLRQLDIPERFRLSDIVIGDPQASSTVIIYSSFTCKHCCQFHLKEWPKFKQKCVDTGKVKVIFRHYLDDQGALDSAILVRCLYKDTSIEKFYAAIFSHQAEWLKSSEPQKFLKKIFIDLGYNQAKIDSCLSSKTIPAGLMLEQKRAMHELRIPSVPTFVINGKTHIGILTAEELAKKIEEKLK
jgi:protein-disulfide isomerase